MSVNTHAFLALACAAAACSRDGSPGTSAPSPASGAAKVSDPSTPAPSTSASASTGQPPEEEVVLAYPGGRMLCEEHLTARRNHPSSEDQRPREPAREITWSSYSTADDASRVVAFYQRVADVGILTTDGDETALRLRSGVRISIFKLPTKQPFPRCSNAAAPTASEQAVVIIHKQTVR